MEAFLFFIIFIIPYNSHPPSWTYFWSGNPCNILEIISITNKTEHRTATTGRSRAKTEERRMALGRRTSRPKMHSTVCIHKTHFTPLQGADWLFTFLQGATDGPLTKENSVPVSLEDGVNLLCGWSRGSGFREVESVQV